MPYLSLKQVEKPTTKYALVHWYQRITTILPCKDTIVLTLYVYMLPYRGALDRDKSFSGNCKNNCWGYRHDFSQLGKRRWGVTIFFVRMLHKYSVSHSPYPRIHCRSKVIADATHCLSMISLYSMPMSTCEGRIVCDGHTTHTRAVVSHHNDDWSTS